MNDLISRSELLKSINEEAKKIPIDAEKYHIDTNVIDGMNATLKAITNIVKEQPTAYDVDKVVEGLEKQSKPLGIGFIPDERYIKEKKAIEIVKQCGVADDVCEWREDAYGRWHTDCHYLADNDPLEYTYCPYCGKKIEVVDNDK